MICPGILTLQSKERGKRMKGKMLIGMAAGTLLGAAAAWAMSGDLNAKGMKKVSRNLEREANKLGIQM